MIERSEPANALNRFLHGERAAYGGQPGSSSPAERMPTVMTADLDFHLANPQERAHAARNVHDVWGRGLDVQEHVRRRLASPKHQYARCYVGCLEGKVVTACSAYPTQLCVDGRIEPACALGSVHTLAEFRGRGFAPRLLGYVEAQELALGSTASLLYSDIAPSYYERLGYLLCSCPEGWADAGSVRADASFSLTPFDRIEQAAAMAELYEQSHAQFPLWIARSPSYWNYLLAQNAASGPGPGDEFFFIGDARGRRVGYLHVCIAGGVLKIRDIALDAPPAEGYPGLLAAAAALAQLRGAARLGGWLPEGAAPDAFRFSERIQELTMIKPLVPRLAVTASHRRAAAFLHEIDHV